MVERDFTLTAAGSGLLFVGFSVGAMLIADLPAAGGDSVTVADYFDAAHVEVVVSVYLQGLGLACFLVFLTGFAWLLRAAGEGWLATTFVAAGVSFAALLAQAALVLGALAYRATDDASVAQSVFDLALLARAFASFPLAVLSAAAGLAILRSGVLPGWYGWSALALTAPSLAAAATYAGSGFFAPGGGCWLLASGLFLAWVFVTSVRLVQGSPNR